MLWLAWQGWRDAPRLSCGRRKRLHNVPFNFPDGKPCQILGNLRNDVTLDIGSERRPKLCQRSRRSGYDKRRRSSPNNLLRSPRNPPREPILLEFVPVRRFDGSPLTQGYRM